MFNLMMVKVVLPLNYKPGSSPINILICFLLKSLANRLEIVRPIVPPFSLEQTEKRTLAHSFRMGDDTRVHHKPAASLERHVTRWVAAVGGTRLRRDIPVIFFWDVADTNGAKRVGRIYQQYPPSVTVDSWKVLWLCAVWCLYPCARDY